jgi:hypothetical protein
MSNFEQILALLSSEIFGEEIRSSIDRMRQQVLCSRNLFCRDMGTAI